MWLLLTAVRPKFCTAFCHLLSIRRFFPYFHGYLVCLCTPYRLGYIPTTCSTLTGEVRSSRKVDRDVMIGIPDAPSLCIVEDVEGGSIGRVVQPEPPNENGFVGQLRIDVAGKA